MTRSIVASPRRLFWSVGPPLSPRHETTRPCLIREAKCSLARKPGEGADGLRRKHETVAVPVLRGDYPLR